mgnify:CR=1 FL=1
MYSPRSSVTVTLLSLDMASSKEPEWDEPAEGLVSLDVAMPVSRRTLRLHVSLSRAAIGAQWVKRLWQAKAQLSAIRGKPTIFSTTPTPVSFLYECHRQFLYVRY